MGRLHGFTVDIEAASALADFEMIEIVDESNPYLALLGIYWAIDMNGVINLKKWTMSFETKSLHIVVPLYPAKGLHYTQPVPNYEESDDDFNQSYKITVWDHDSINPKSNWRIACDRESYYTLDSDEELEHWQNRLHEVSTLWCFMMTKSMCCMSSEVRNLPHYDGLTDVEKFIDAFEQEVPEDHRFQAVDLVLCTTPTWWWGTHKDSFEEWRDYGRMMRLRFGSPKVWLTEKYDGRNVLCDHLAKWTKV